MSYVPCPMPATNLHAYSKIAATSISEAVNHSRFSDPTATTAYIHLTDEETSRYFDQHSNFPLPATLPDFTVMINNLLSTMQSLIKQGVVTTDWHINYGSGHERFRSQLEEAVHGFNSRHGTKVSAHRDLTQEKGWQEDGAALEIMESKLAEILPEPTGTMPSEKQAKPFSVV